jgi:hypothetical protein
MEQPPGQAAWGQLSLEKQPQRPVPLERTAPGAARARTAVESPHAAEDASAARALHVRAPVHQLPRERPIGAPGDGPHAHHGEHQPGGRFRDGGRALVKA